MREIKFRFIFKDGCFFRTRYMTLDELLDSNFALESMEEDINAESDICTDEDYPEYEVFKCQYAGLKDKNGVEIYEGDIVKTADDDEPYMKVEYDCDDAMFCLIQEQKYTFNFIEFYGKELQVIGNIYENPELLEEEK